MQAEIMSSTWRISKYVYHGVIREINLIWMFVKRDFPSTVVAALIFLIAAWKSNNLSSDELVIGLGRGFFYFLLYILSFCIANQILGVEEDRLNKPDRPIVSGAVSYNGALVRLVISQLAFTLLGLCFGILKWTLLWQFFTFLYHVARWDRNWITKGLVVGAGAFLHLVPAWELIAPITPIGWNWILMMSVIWTILVPVQDFRDIEGDRTVNRKTLPMVIGEKAGRVVVSLGFILLPVAVHMILMMPAGNTLNVLLCDIVLAMWSWMIAARIIFYQNPKADHLTYMLFTYWYCLALTSAIVIL
ncbi:MAG: UbiA family prenyltransferase [Methylacidiphilales bacterium]|nr:UbiA family prenyltransferase [Candidatus Methylacidiphilales bacterium]NJR16186.1 UbiA family prenyltransferase [Calothrix sp. CSU_2_0]